MKKFLLILCALTLVFGMAGRASAVSFTNGGFETGDFTGWDLPTSADGRASVVTADSGFSATEGTYFANLTANFFIAQNQSWAEGETFSFDWNFNANDYLPYNDFSILAIMSGGFPIDVVTLANVQSAGDYAATGWNTYNYTFAAAGSGSIGFGVYNSLDTASDSQLYIDNVGGSNGNGTSPVPEPSTILLMGVGLLGLAGYSRKKFNKKM
jgi:hypothetical protein